MDTASVKHLGLEYRLFVAVEEAAETVELVKDEDDLVVELETFPEVKTGELAVDTASPELVAANDEVLPTGLGLVVGALVVVIRSVVAVFVGKTVSKINLGVLDEEDVDEEVLDVEVFDEEVFEVGKIVPTTGLPFALTDEVVNSGPWELLKDT